MKVDFINYFMLLVESVEYIVDVHSGLTRSHRPSKGAINANCWHNSNHLSSRFTELELENYSDLTKLA